MSFLYEPIVEKPFNNFAELYKWVGDQEAKLVRIPILGLIENGARFLDDEFFGGSSLPFKFNSHALRSFSSYLGLRMDVLDLIEKPELATDLLNDLICQQEIQKRLSRLEFVLDEDLGTVIGIVSKSYLSYGNRKFLDDLSLLLNDKKSTQQLPLFPSIDNTKFCFNSGYWINTRTVVRLTSKIESGKIIGKGGDGKDISEIGMQVKNSMVGDSAVTIDYFINRLLCANGLIAPVASSMNRVFHSGKKESFAERLKATFSQVERTLERAGSLIKELLEVQYTPLLLAKNKVSERIFEIIPSSRSTILEKKNMKKQPDRDLSEEDKIKREASIIDGIHECYAGEHSKKVFTSQYRNNATMFDFINVFTEYAKTESLEKKVEIEEKSGALADWIVKNKKKFVTN